VTTPTLVAVAATQLKRTHGLIVYHHPGCRTLGKRTVVEVSLPVAAKAGWKPCQRCL
jgi:methylphosphotriester-DNA--protein-cysteine methyltransferase